VEGPKKEKVMHELTDRELDAVGAAAGQANGLVAVNVSDITVSHVLENFLNSNSVANNSLNNLTVQLPVGIAAGVLGLANASSLAHRA
jgi:hypothetical protein